MIGFVSDSKVFISKDVHRNFPVIVFDFHSVLAFFLIE